MLGVMRFTRPLVGTSSSTIRTQAAVRQYRHVLLGLVSFKSGESQWDHPCDHELRELYAHEKAKKVKQLSEVAEVVAPSTPCNLSVSSICEETSPQRSFDEQTPSPQVSPVPLERRGLAALAACAAKANTEDNSLPALSVIKQIKQVQLMPERPSKPPPARLRPPRPKPSRLDCFEEAAALFCRSPAAQSPDPKQVNPRVPSNEEMAERAVPGDVKSPPTPRLSAVLTAELCISESEAAGDQISLWSRLEKGEETLRQALPQSQRADSSMHSMSADRDNDSLEISSLTAVLENSNLLENEGTSRDSSALPPQEKQPQSPSAWADSPTGADAAGPLSELRRLREQLENKDPGADHCQASETSSPQGGKPDLDFKEDGHHSQEKPVQDSTTQTDDTTTASTGEAEHLSKAADWPGLLSPLDAPAQDENSPPASLKGDALAVQESMACLTAELNALSCKAAERSKLSDLPRNGRHLKDVTNELRGVPDVGLKLPASPRSMAGWMDIANMRMQQELQEQQRAALERQLDECVSACSMEQAAHAATKAALRESQREVLRLSSQVQFKETETQRLEMELQRCQSELGSVFDQAKQAQVQLKAQQAELAQVKMRLRNSNAELRPTHQMPSHAVCGLSAATQEPKASSGSLTQLTQGLENVTGADIADSTLRNGRSAHATGALLAKRCMHAAQSISAASGVRLASEVSDALRKRRKELRRRHAELEQVLGLCGSAWHDDAGALL